MASNTISRTTAAEALSFEKLAVYTVNTSKAGKVRSVREYIDTDTGEPIAAEHLNVPVLDLREKLPARCKALESLRPEVRQFATFVLRFANLRRGITPGIGTLCQWYADLAGRRSDNVRRYIPALNKAGILAGETLLGPLFQRTGGRARDHLGEEYRAGCIYTSMLAKARQIPSAPGRLAPAALLAAEVARLDAELAADQAAWAGVLAEQAIARASRPEVEHA